MIIEKESVLGKIWHKTNINENLVSQIKTYMNISDFLATLIARNSHNLEEAEKILYPKIKTLLPDPFHLRDMQKGVDRVIKAILGNEKICIFADYDVDGATSSALLKNVFDELKVNSFIYVPDRITEGYGPSCSGMKYIKNQSTSLVITVDCGSVAFEAIDYANEIGLDIIVIDHHLTIDQIPKAVAIINPNRLDEISEYRNLAAVGVSFLFAVALCNSLKKQNFFASCNITYPNLMQQLDLVALGTVCDVMPLTGLNRAFVAQGLKIAKQRQNIGYNALCDIAGIDSALNPYHLGFILGPRINAGGRVGKSCLGANLLSTKNVQEAKLLAAELDQYNEERKTIELLLLAEAKQQAEAQKANSIIFIIGKNWHPGVIGIIAGRIKEQYNKPVAVIALSEEGVGKASCRSVKGIDFGCEIIDAKQRGLLIAGGGHAMAAGFTVLEKDLHSLQEFLTIKFNKLLSNYKEHLNSYYDFEVKTDSVNIRLLDEIMQLEPYGLGYPAPIFKFRKMYVLKADIVGVKHARIIFAPEKKSYAKHTISAISFNVTDSAMQDVIFSKKPLLLDLIGKLQMNKWQNNNKIQLILEDVIINSNL